MVAALGDSWFEYWNTNGRVHGDDETAEVRRVHVRLLFFVRDGLALQEAPCGGFRILVKTDASSITPSTRDGSRAPTRNLATAPAVQVELPKRP